MKNLLFFIGLLCMPFVSRSQGEDCTNATYLTDVTDFCSGNGFYTNASAVASGYSVAACWGAGATADVWFQFIASGTDLLGSVAGSGYGGTMSAPRVAVYSGVCGGTLSELACEGGSGIVQFYEGGLVPGTTYYIRVSSNSANRGTFRLCLNNYTPTSNPGADCGGATHLCSKTTVGVSQFSGGGSDNSEPDGDAGTCMEGETNSVWYTWTCGTSGSLTFDISPLDPSKDIDYVLYQLSTANPCGGRTIIRCNTSSCIASTNGETGLSMTDTDSSEDPGCDFGENAYCKFINMTAGTSYALLINNADNVSGFNLSWGGTGTFQGPLPDIATVDNTVCIGESLTFDGSSSTNVGGGLQWTFSNGTTIENQTGAGPFTVNYAAAGNYVAILEGTDALGCTETDIVNLTVSPNPAVTAGPDRNVCVGASVTLAGAGASSYTWDNGVSNNGPFSAASTQTYTVTGTDVNGCQNTDQVLVTVNPLPVVNAGTDQGVCSGGQITLSGSGADSYSWNNGVTNSAAFTPASTQTYTVTGTDANNCQNTDQVLVTVNSLPAVNAGTDQSVCVGGQVTLSGSGAASYTWNNSVNDATAFTPAGTQTYTVTGTDANNCQNTDQVLVTVNPLPVVNAGTDQSVCVGGQVTLSGSGASSYTWNNSVNDATAFSPSGTQTYTVTGTDANNCQNTDQVVVTVNSLPAVSAGTDQSVCANGQITLSGSGASSYAWNNSVTNGTAFSPSATQTYTVTGTDANNCQNTDQVLVTVNPLPVVNAGTDQSVCVGGQATLSGSGATSYAWNNGVTNGNEFSPAATQTYTVTGTDANNCQNTDQVTVTVNPLPAVNAGADQSVCAGGQVTLTATGASSYAWNVGLTNGSPFTPAGTQTYTVTGTDANNCENSDQVVVTVIPLPVVNAGTDQSVCAGGQVTLSGSGASSYTWNNGVTDAAAFSPASTQTYTVTGTIGNCQNTDQVLVTVNPLPVVNAGTDQTVCAGSQVVLSGSGAVSYSWNNSVINGTAFAPGSTQTYTITGTDANNCSNTDAVVVTVLPLPQSEILTSGPLYGQPGLTVGFSNGSSYANSYEWDFGNGQDESTTDITDAYSISYQETGTYQVELLVSNGTCTDLDMITVIVQEKPLVILDVPNVFTPNGDGTNDVFNLNVENAASLDIIIVNRWGNTIAEFNGLTSAWDGKTSGGEDVTSGVYYFTYTATGIDGSSYSGQGFVQVAR